MSHELSTYVCGTTIRLIGEFFTYEGEPIDVNFTKVIIYDYKYNRLNQFILHSENRIGVGKYFYDYVSDATPKKIIYEFYGELDGLPVLNRDSFTTKFII